MPRALVDTSVLFAAVYRRDSAHDDALPILHGIDAGSLPDAIITEHVLVETLNGLGARAGHDAAVDFLDRVESNTRFHVESLSADVIAAGKALFRRHESLSFVDACLLAYMDVEGYEYLYAFDDDFDVVADVSRIDTPTNPYDPKKGI